MRTRDMSSQRHVYVANGTMKYETNYMSRSVPI